MYGPWLLQVEELLRKNRRAEELAVSAEAVEEKGADGSGGRNPLCTLLCYPALATYRTAALLYRLERESPEERRGRNECQPPPAEEALRLELSGRPSIEASRSEGGASRAFSLVIVGEEGTLPEFQLPHQLYLQLKLRHLLLAGHAVVWNVRHVTLTREVLENSFLIDAAKSPFVADSRPPERVDGGR